MQHSLSPMIADVSAVMDILARRTADIVVNIAHIAKSLTKQITPLPISNY
jgi:hypothetical protein